MKNKIALVGEAWGEIPLTKGYVALVDLEDVERIAAHNWCAVVRPSGNVHAMRKGPSNETIWMHHEVMQRKPVVFDVDHKNRNGIDNRKNNLRLLSRRHNLLNTKRSEESSLIERHGNRFRVRPWIEGKRTVIGSFKTREEAEAAVTEYRRGQYSSCR